MKSKSLIEAAATRAMRKGLRQMGIPLSVNEAKDDVQRAIGLKPKRKKK